MTSVQLGFMTKIFDLTQTEIDTLASFGLVMSDDNVLAFGTTLAKKMEKYSAIVVGSFVTLNDAFASLDGIGEISGLITYSMLMSLLKYEPSSLSGERLRIFEELASEIRDRTKKEIIEEATVRLDAAAKAVKDMTDSDKKDDKPQNGGDSKWGKA
jgi:hypothetical protein